MQENLAEFTVCRADYLDQQDGAWRNHMAEISELIRPLRRELRGGRTMEGEKRMTRVFDSTAINAAGNLGAGLYGTAESRQIGRNRGQPYDSADRAGAIERALRPFEHVDRLHVV